MVQKRETKAINKLCVREILSLSFVCGPYFFEFRGRNLLCFVIAYNFNGKYAPVCADSREDTHARRACLCAGHDLHTCKNEITRQKFMFITLTSWYGAPTHSYVTNVFLYNLYIAIFSRV